MREITRRDWPDWALTTTTTTSTPTLYGIAVCLALATDHWNEIGFQLRQVHELLDFLSPIDEWTFAFLLRTGFTHAVSAAKREYTSHVHTDRHASG